MVQYNLSDSVLPLAVEKFQQGNLDDAQQLFLTILHEDKHHPDALYFMTLIDQKSGRLEVAEHRAFTLLEQKPNDLKALNLLATVQMSMGKLNEAAESYVSAIDQNTNDPRTFVNAAICQIGLADPDKSIDYCKRALKIDPNYLNALNILGNAYLGKCEYENAISIFKAALEKQPEFIDARFNLGRALYEADKLDEALNIFESVIELSPRNFHALTCKAEILSARHLNDEAFELFESALSINNKHTPAYIGLGVLYRRNGQLNEAIASFKHAIELNPNNLDALMYAGETFRKMGNQEAAAAAFKDVLTIDPDNAQAKFHLATVDDSTVPSKPDSEYVRKLFDEFAYSYDDSLHKIEYDAPKQLATLLENSIDQDSLHDLNILDLGCGTGLSGVQFAQYSKHLKGIDISPKMVNAAHKTDVYDELEVNEILDALVKHQNDTDLAIAADAFPYIGDLESIFLAISSALRPEGLLLFTTEAHDQLEHYILKNTARYSHSLEYLRELSSRRNFKMLACKRQAYRKESGKPVDGFIVLLQKNKLTDNAL